MTKNYLQKNPFYNLNSFFVGFDSFFNEASKIHSELTAGIPNYPPFNIKKIDENKYSIELAVAGFSRSEIDIEFVDDKLIIKGKANSDDKQPEYFYKGISNRAFTRTFSLNDSIEIKNAELFNGILQVVLERIIPEHKKPKKIDIKDTSTKTFLAEEKND